jgi:pimeloyl-ACP methyl ester carboxylesterase
MMREHGPVAVVGGELDDHPAVLELIERFEGAESAALAERWLAAQPENLMVVRTPAGLARFMFPVVYPTDPSLCDADPLVRTILDHAATSSPARPGEQVWIGRFFGGAADYQHDPHRVAIGAVAGTIEWVTRPADHVVGPWRYERFEDTGHRLQLERPQRVNGLLLDFLNETTGREGSARTGPR